MLEKFFVYIVLAIVILFQSDIKRGLACADRHEERACCAPPDPLGRQAATTTGRSTRARRRGRWAEPRAALSFRLRWGRLSRLMGLPSFVIGAFWAGIAGGLITFYRSSIFPTQFQYDRSIELLAMVVLGGTGSLSAPSWRAPSSPTQRVPRRV